eukprot:SAG11_NODE_15498_length_576_cov_0.932914_2_plen_71_part_01
MYAKYIHEILQYFRFLHTYRGVKRMVVAERPAAAAPAGLTMRGSRKLDFPPHLGTKFTKIHDGNGSINHHT